VNLESLIDDRVRALAESVDCITEDDLARLGGVTLGTVEAWRKRGEGPPYIVFGNTILYPRPGLREHLGSRVRERRRVPVKAIL